jgi:ABC-type Zn uptake system ZnuABC Zn-binding protein ZnuA
MKDEEFQKNLKALLDKLEKIEWKARRKIKAETRDSKPVSNVSSEK